MVKATTIRHGFVLYEYILDITLADGSHVSIASSTSLSVCPHGKTETAETKIAKLGTERVITMSCPPVNIWSKVGWVAQW